MKQPLLKQARQAVLLGQMSGDTKRKQCHEYLDIGCDRVKEIYNYQGQCQDCPLEMCLEDRGRHYNNQHMSRVKERCTKLKTMIGYMDVKEIAERLGVDKVTIYSDLRSLAKEGVTHQSHIWFMG